MKEAPRGSDSPDGGLPKEKVEKQIIEARSVLNMRPNTANILAATALGRDPFDVNGDQLNASSKKIHKVLPQKKPDDIIYDSIEKESLANRKNYWKKQKKTLSFEEQNKRWNSGIQNWVSDHMENETVSRALASLFDPRNTSEILGKDPRNLTDIDFVEGFRLNYFDQGSDIKKFVTDIAKDCMEKNGKTENVDLIQLQERLDAVRDLLICFGEEESNIPELVQDYALSHGLLSQKPEVKQGIADYLVPSESPRPAPIDEKANKEKEKSAAEIVMGAATRAKERENGKSNQDAFFTLEKRKGSSVNVAGVFDGMTNSFRGDIAATTASETITRVLETSDQITKQQMIKAVEEANLAILNNPDVKGRLSATTASVVGIEEKDGKFDATILQVGDSEIHLLRADGKGGVELVKLSDVAYGEGQLGEKWLGIRDDIRFSVLQHRLNPGEQLVLLTDGAYNNLFELNSNDKSEKEKKVAVEILQNNPPEVAANELTKKAKNHAEQFPLSDIFNDDITVAVVAIPGQLDKSLAPRETEAEIRNKTEVYVLDFKQENGENSEQKNFAELTPEERDLAAAMIGIASSELNRDEYHLLVKKFKEDPFALIARTRDALIHTPITPEDERTKILEHYFDSYLSLQIKLDRIAFPPDDGVAFGVPKYIPDGLSDMGSDSAIYTKDRNGREKIRIDKAGVFKFTKPLLREIFLSKELSKLSTPEWEALVTQKIAEYVYDAMPYNHADGNADNAGKSVRLDRIFEDKIAVCRHHALMTQVLLQTSGITSRLMKSILATDYNSGSHANNLVNIDQRWYLLDSTNRFVLESLVPQPDQGLDLNNEGYQWKFNIRGRDVTYQSRSNMYYRIRDNIEDPPSEDAELTTLREVDYLDEE